MHFSESALEKQKKLIEKNRLYMHNIQSFEHVIKKFWIVKTIFMNMKWSIRTDNFVPFRFSILIYSCMWFCTATWWVNFEFQAVRFTPSHYLFNFLKIFYKSFRSVNLEFNSWNFGFISEKYFDDSKVWLRRTNHKRECLKRI